jgi:beta-galactosidase/beta-glucuronidase
VLNSPGDDALTSLRATRQDGTYPRPQLMRRDWADLSGPWGFAFDDDDRGTGEGWHRRPVGPRSIVVPFPPESPASGIGDTGFHPVVWYSRSLTRAELDGAGLGGAAPRLLVHFGAVDYRARVWLNGVLLGEHEGGHTPFTVDATDALDPDLDEQLLVVRAEDDPADVTQPRGKQDWRLDPHVIWYHRTTGIWQPVWLEAVPRTSVAALRWTSDLPSSTVDLSVELRGPVPAVRPTTAGPTATETVPTAPDEAPAAADQARLEVVIRHDERELARVTVPVTSRHVPLRIVLPDQRNGQSYEELLWSPESPTLLDATVTLVSGDATDVVASYLGLRSVEVAGDRFLLNDRPYFVRSVLEQGYWPESHLAAPSAEALRVEVELIKSLGFTATRVHQKVEDPRFLWWADRLGLLVWGEMAGAFEFSPTAVARLAAEWTEAVQRDVSHPCIVTWVPVNESWGVQHVAHDPAQQAFVRAMAELTRALDPSRPVVSNDGWEHLASDIITVHDYEASPEVVAERYGSEEARFRLLDGHGPAGRRVLLPGSTSPGAPVMLTEFGGIRFDTAVEGTEGAWGYSSAASAEQFTEQLTGLLGAVTASPFLAGFCYTQLTDTLQEANGLLDEHRRPKIPVEVIRAAVDPRGGRG